MYDEAMILHAAIDTPAPVPGSGSKTHIQIQQYDAECGVISARAKQTYDSLNPPRVTAKVVRACSALHACGLTVLPVVVKHRA